MAKSRSMYCNQLMAAAAILKFAAIKAGATESNPLKLGNAEFWIDAGCWEGSLVHDPPSNQWDRLAVQNDLDAFLADKMDDLRAYIKAQSIPECLEITK